MSQEKQQDMGASGKPDEVTKLPQEALAAWVEYEPPTIQSNNPLVIANGVMRHAFMTGFLAGQAVGNADAPEPRQPPPQNTPNPTPEDTQ